MRIERHEQMALNALIASLRSTCGRRAVGAIIERDGRVISTGYAGPPSGFPHCSQACMDEHKSTGCGKTIHAEANAIAYSARHGISTEGATLYCTLSPCKTCAGMIVSAGISRVYYIEPYRDSSGLELLEKAAIPCEMINVNYAHLLNLLQRFAYGDRALPLLE